MPIGVLYLVVAAPALAVILVYLFWRAREQTHAEAALLQPALSALETWCDELLALVDEGQTLLDSAAITNKASAMLGEIYQLRSRINQAASHASELREAYSAALKTLGVNLNGVLAPLNEANAAVQSVHVQARRASSEGPPELFRATARSAGAKISTLGVHARALSASLAAWRLSLSPGRRAGTGRRPRAAAAG